MTKNTKIEKFVAEFNALCRKNGVRKFTLHSNAKSTWLKFNFNQVGDRLAYNLMYNLSNLKKWYDITWFGENTGKYTIYTK